jgi:cystathionine beta-lyase/cystathionine gamma-synthase
MRSRCDARFERRRRACRSPPREATRLHLPVVGAVESLIELPAVMTHLSVAGSPLEVPAGLVRLSVGIESADDLIADLEAALRVSSG